MRSFVRPGLLGITLLSLLFSPAARAQDSDSTEEAVKEARAVVGETRQLAAQTGGSVKIDRFRSSASRLVKALSRESSDDEAISEAFAQLESCWTELERDEAISAGNGLVKQIILNLRWKVRRLGEILGGDEEERSFTVGPVTEEQAQSLNARLDEMLQSAGTMKGLLGQSDPDIMYRNLLMLQMQSLVEPVAVVRQELRGIPPWWTPETYRAVLQIQRIINLTRNETRKLPPSLLTCLRQVWTASEAVVRAVNEIERGARDSGSDAKIIYRPRPGRR